MSIKLFKAVFSSLFVLFTAFSCAQQEPMALKVIEQPALQTGADQLFNEPYYSWIKNKGVGLITNQTGVNSELEGLPGLLSGRDDINLAALFGPEHGIYGEAEAGDDVAERSNVYNLYGDHQAPTPEMLEGVDVLIYDIQDVGSRFYTFISTMYECMKSVSGTGITFIVLDRPNPIGGDRVEGPVLEEGFESFVGIHTIPNRYGMTAGELAMFLTEETGLDLELKIVPVKGWSRDQDFSDYGNEWINPSPNMPGFKAALSYPGFCLVEGTNMSEGRGTTKPFEYFGAPWINSASLAQKLNSLNLPGLKFRPQMFTPSFSKHQGEACGGVQLHIIDKDLFQPLPSALHFIKTVAEMYPDQFSFREAGFDRLCGNSWVRTRLQEGAEVVSIEAEWQEKLEAFKAARAKYLLY
jgi:uncharacterized protein YbbC (DUF1343 family)